MATFDRVPETISFLWATGFLTAFIFSLDRALATSQAHGFTVLCLKIECVDFLRFPTLVDTADLMTEGAEVETGQRDEEYRDNGQMARRTRSTGSATDRRTDGKDEE